MVQILFTRKHVCMMWDEVGVATDIQQEHSGVGGPGHQPDHQQHYGGPTQLGLGL